MKTLLFSVIFLSFLFIGCSAYHSDASYEIQSDPIEFAIHHGDGSAESLTSATDSLTGEWLVQVLNELEQRDGETISSVYVYLNNDDSINNVYDTDWERPIKMEIVNGNYEIWQYRYLTAGWETKGESFISYQKAVQALVQQAHSHANEWNIGMINMGNSHVSNYKPQFVRVFYKKDDDLKRG